MGKIYRGTSGAQYQIEEQRLAGGGEGSVLEYKDNLSL